VNAISLVDDQKPAKTDHEITAPLDKEKIKGRATNKEDPLQDLKLQISNVKKIDKFSVGPRNYVKAVSSLSMTFVEQLKNVLDDYGKALGRIFGSAFLYGHEEELKSFIEDLIQSTVTTVAEKTTLREAVSGLLGDQYAKLRSSFRVPDWIQLYVKFATKLSDKSWQTMLNYLNVGNTGVSTQLLSFLSINLFIHHRLLSFMSFGLFHLIAFLVYYLLLFDR